MSARRQFLRGLALLPAALKPAAEALASTAASIGHESAPVGMPPYVNQLPIGRSLAEKMAARALRAVSNERERRAKGRLADIDLDLWAIRSYSPAYRASKQIDRELDYHARSSPFLKALGYIVIDEE